MTEEEIDELAKAVSKKIQADLVNSIYSDAGKNLFGLLKSLLWGAVVFLAAWGASTHVGDVK